MSGNIKDKKCGLKRATSLALLITTVIILFSSFVAAEAQGKVKSENKSIANYQGTVSGEWGGDVSVSNDSWVVNGTFSVTISADGIVSGTFSGFKSGTITGTISPSGEINAKGSAGFSEWKGQVNVENGHLSGSGTWKGYGGTGSWKSK